MTHRIARIEPRPWVSARSVVVAAALFALSLGVLGAVALSGAGQPFGPMGVRINPLYVFSGLTVGIIVGLTGVGGGSLMTPLLVLVFGFHPGAAVGTDLLYASATKGVGTIVHNANKTVDWTITRRLAFGSVPATLATVALLYMLHLKGDGASRLISTVLGYALLVTAATLVFRRQLSAMAERRSIGFGPRTTLALTVLLGAALGALITLSSVGAGAIGVTVLIFLYPKMPVARIVGSDIAHAVPLTLIGGAGHWLLGSVNLPLLGSLLVGSIPGIVIGSQLTPRVPEGVLRPILATVLILVGAKLVF